MTRGVELGLVNLVWSLIYTAVIWLLVGGRWPWDWRGRRKHLKLRPRDRDWDE